MVNEETKQKQAQEDLRFIREMLQETRRHVADNGLHYISWTIVVALGIISTYGILLSRISPSNILWVWVAAIGIGWLLSFFIGSRQSNDRSQNFAEKVLSTVWIASGISMTIIGFGVSAAVSLPNLIPALIATVLGIPYFTASVIYDLPWFRLVAAGWWLAGIGFFLWNSFHTLAVLGVLMLLLQALPGIYIYKHYGTAQQDI